MKNIIPVRHRIADIDNRLTSISITATDATHTHIYFGRFHLLFFPFVGDNIILPVHDPMTDDADNVTDPNHVQ